MKAAEDRMRALGLLTPLSTFALDEWEIPRDRVVTNRYTAPHAQISGITIRVS